MGVHPLQWDDAAMVPIIGSNRDVARQSMRTSTQHSAPHCANRPPGGMWYAGCRTNPPIYVYSAPWQACMRYSHARQVCATLPLLPTSAPPGRVEVGRQVAWGPIGASQGTMQKARAARASRRATWPWQTPRPKSLSAVPASARYRRAAPLRGFAQTGPPALPQGREHG